MGLIPFSALRPESVKSTLDKPQISAGKEWALVIIASLGIGALVVFGVLLLRTVSCNG